MLVDSLVTGKRLLNTVVHNNPFTNYYSIFEFVFLLLAHEF